MLHTWVIHQNVSFFISAFHSIRKAFLLCFPNSLLLDTLFSCLETSALGWLRWRKEDAEEGTPVFPQYFFPPYPWLVLSFPGGIWAVDSPKDVSSAEGLRNGLAVSASCLMQRRHKRPSYIFTWHKLSDVKNELLPYMYVILSCWIVFCLKYMFLGVKHFQLIKKHWINTLG